MIGKRQRIKNALKHGHKSGFELASCYGKIIYNTSKEAHAAAINLINAHSYKCKFCDYFHVGRKPK